MRRFTSFFTAAFVFCGGASFAQDLATIGLYWSSEKSDNFTSRSNRALGRVLEPDYRFARHEGCIFEQQIEGTVPAHTYYGKARNDAFLTATQQGRRDAENAGYEEISLEGFVFPDPKDGLVPLKLFWSSDRQDNFTTSTAQGEAAALIAGYRFVRNEGYVFPLSRCDGSTDTNNSGIGTSTQSLSNAFDDSNTPSRNATVLFNNGCSGVLVSPTIVLSAGHCWDPIGGRPIPTGATPFASGTRHWETPGVWYPTPTGFSVRIGSNDRTTGTVFSVVNYSIAGSADVIALQLATQVPSGLAIPADVITTDGPSNTYAEIRGFLSGKTLRYAGWGGLGNGTIPQFRQTVGDVVFDGWPVNVWVPNPVQVKTHSPSGARIIPGDSGGPLYWDDGGRLRLLGIVQGEGRHLMTFFRGGRTGPGPDAVFGSAAPDIALWINELLNRDNCHPVQTDSLRVTRNDRDGRTRYSLIERLSDRKFYSFSNQSDAIRTMTIIADHRVTRLCSLNRSGGGFFYFLTETDLPENRSSVEDCIPIETAGSYIVGGGAVRWSVLGTVLGGPEILADFYYPRESRGLSYTLPSRESAYSEASAALAFFRRYQPTFKCFVGRGEPEFSYYRK